MKTTRFAALVLALALCLAAACAEEPAGEEFAWSDHGNYLTSALQGKREIRTEEEAQAYAEELWQFLSDAPLPEGRSEMSVDRADNSYHYGVFDEDDVNVYAANFLSNGLVQQFGYSDSDDRWHTEGMYTNPEEVPDPEAWKKAQDYLAETVDRINPGIMALVGPMQVNRIFDVGDRMYLIISAEALDPAYECGLDIIAVLYPDGRCELKDFSCYGAG